MSPDDLIAQDRNRFSSGAWNGGGAHTPNGFRRHHPGGQWRFERARSNFANSPAPVDLAKISNDQTIEVINADPDIPEVNRMAPGPRQESLTGQRGHCHDDGQDWFGRYWRRPTARDGTPAVKSLK